MPNSLICIRVLQDEAVKGGTYLDHKIVSVSPKTHFYPRQGQCKIFPFRLLPPGTYVFVRLAKGKGSWSSENTHQWKV